MSPARRTWCTSSRRPRPRASRARFAARRYLNPEPCTVKPEGALPCAQDVVYYFAPATPARVTVSLCGSAAHSDAFDTQLYVVADLAQRSGGRPLQPLACNDDYCGLLSQITVSRLPVLHPCPAACSTACCMSCDGSHEQGDLGGFKKDLPRLLLYWSGGWSGGWVASGRFKHERQA